MSARLLSQKNVFIVAAKRTPFGSFGGKLKSWSCTDLAVHASSAAIAQCDIDPAAISSVCVGNVSQTNPDTPYLARHVGLRSGVPIATPALTVNRLCGSGFQSIITGAQEILLGLSDVVLTGGAESMSSAPYALRNARWGSKVGSDLALKDTLWETLTDAYTKTPMANTAENLAEQYSISRQACDEYAVRSQHAWAAAANSGIFSQEIAPISIKSRKGEQVMDADEGGRPDATIEAVGKLPALFKKDGTVTAGNASGISDGAGAVIIASEEAVKTHNLKPIARLAAFSVAGVDPNVMGIGPVPAIRQVLTDSEKSLEDIDIVEVNEAFAAQYLAVEKELGLDRAKTNVNGGAIALGHPTGASGSRIMGHLAYELQRNEKNMAIGSACIGGGQGVAIMIERV